MVAFLLHFVLYTDRCEVKLIMQGIVREHGCLCTLFVLCCEECYNECYAF